MTFKTDQSIRVYYARKNLVGDVVVFLTENPCLLRIHEDMRRVVRDRDER